MCQYCSLEVQRGNVYIVLCIDCFFEHKLFNEVTMLKKHALGIGVIFTLLQSIWIMVELRFRKTTEAFREFLNFFSEDGSLGNIAGILLPLSLISVIWGFLLIYQVTLIGPNERVTTSRELCFKGISALVALFVLWDIGYSLTAYILPPLKIGPLRLGIDMLILIFAYRFHKEALRTRSVSLQQVIRETNLS